MPVYLGSLGRLVKLPYVGSQQVQSEERYNFSSTLEGKRKAQVKPNGPRTWALSADHFRPNEHSLLSQFADGAWGPGPFQFIPADAPHTNLMTPDGSLTIDSQPSAHVIRGGPVDLGADGWASSSLLSDDPLVNFEMFGSMVYTPVIQGKPVTVSAWISAVPGSTARVRLYWYNSSAQLLGGVLSREVQPSEGMARVSATGSPPAGAVSCRVVTLRAASLVRPAITWTDQMMPWSVGSGCRQAVVSGSSRDLVLAVPGHTYSNLSFTVTEVG